MAFLVPRKPSPSSNSTTPCSSYEDDKSLVGAQSNVTSCLYLKPKGSDHEAATARSFEKDAVLRRIRHRKRVNRIRGATGSFFMAPQEQGEKVREADGWLEDAFSSP